MSDPAQHHQGLSTCRRCWNNFLAAMMFVFRTLCYYCCSFKGVTIEEYLRIRKARRTIGGILALIGFTLFALISILKLATFKHLNDVVMPFVGFGFFFIFCLPFQILELKTHVAEVRKTGWGIQKGHENPTADPTQETVDAQARAETLPDFSPGVARTRDVAISTPRDLLADSVAEASSSRFPDLLDMKFIDDEENEEIGKCSKQVLQFAAQQNLEETAL